MKPEQLYVELKHIAEKFDIVVSEQNFRATGIKVKSGFCKIKGKSHCIIDKHLKTNRKLDVLAACLSKTPHEQVYMMPAVRDFLNLYRSEKDIDESPGDPDDE